MRRFLPLLALLGCSDPKPPTSCAELPQLSVNVGERATAEPCFEDPEGGALKITATSLDPTVATASLLGDKVAVRGVAPGLTTVSITATDPDSLSVSVDLSVLVPNRAPTGMLADVNLRPGVPLTINLADHFSDPDGQELAYTASSSAPAIVDFSVSGALLTLSPSGAVGSADISVTATDGEESVTAMFVATVKAPVLLLVDDFNSDLSLDDWQTNDYGSAKIDGGYYVLTADSSGFYAIAGQELGGEAEDWTVEIALRVTDEDAQAGFWVGTGNSSYPVYQFFVGDATYSSLGDLNWIFAWYNDAAGGWRVDDWSYGTSSDIDESKDMEVSLSVTATGFRATVDGKLLFEHGSEDYLVNTADEFLLATSPEGVSGVPSGMNWVRFLAGEFTKTSPAAYVRPDLAKFKPLLKKK
jgi:hypothetical protein